MENRLRERRKELSLSLRAVAVRLGLKDHAWISRWESGRTVPSLGNAFALSIVYETPVEGLFPEVLSAIREEQMGRRIGVDTSGKPILRVTKRIVF